MDKIVKIVKEALNSRIAYPGCDPVDIGAAVQKAEFALHGILHDSGEISTIKNMLKLTGGK